MEGGNLNSHGAFSIGQSVNDSGRSPSYLVSDLVGHFLLKTANFKHPTLFSWSLPFKKGYYSPVEGILDSFQKKERVEEPEWKRWTMCVLPERKKQSKRERKLQKELFTRRGAYSVSPISAIRAIETSSGFCYECLLYYV